MQAPLQARNDSDAAQTDTAGTVAQKRSLADNRPEAVAQRQLAETMNNSPRMLQQRALSKEIHNSPRMVVQRHEMNRLLRGTVQAQADGAMPDEASPAQRKEKTNNTGLPNQLKAGIESLSGMSMDHVKVHYNSDKPAQLQAHAYAQGSEIHLGAGQEKHLPHEAWHVVQQAQGRVRPTLQMKAGTVNDDPSLEKEADIMGEKATQSESGNDARSLVAAERVAGEVTQRVCETSTAPTGTGVVQRIVHLTASQYKARVSPDAHLTQAALREYLNVALLDDLIFANGYADNQNILTCADNVQRGEKTAIKHYFTTVKMDPVEGNTAPNVAAADELAQIVNAITARATIHHPAYNIPPVGAAHGGVAATIPIPNAATRYSHAPLAGYTHSNLVPGTTPVNWSNEADGQSKFAGSAGAALLAAPAHAPRNVEKAVGDQTNIKVLTWDQAKQFLPRPLINLLFDVKSQLVAGAPLIDERTPFEQSERKATADQPGTLRGWHEDSKGALPSNGVAGVHVSKQAAIPGHSTPLHTHYAGTSKAGSGSAAGSAVAPLGFAEYTGAGVGHIHNIKVVLDYVTNRVYLTLSHYQYWGMVHLDGVYHFIPGDSQELDNAKSKIADHATTKAAAGAYTLMHPWMEVLVP